MKATDDIWSTAGNPGSAGPAGSTAAGDLAGDHTGAARRTGDAPDLTRGDRASASTLERGAGSTPTLRLDGDTPPADPSGDDNPLKTSSSGGLGNDLASLFGHPPTGDSGSGAPSPPAEAPPAEEPPAPADIFAREAEPAAAPEETGDAIEGAELLFDKHDGGQAIGDFDAGIVAYDFSQPVQLGPELEQSMRDAHERIARRLSNALSLYVGTEIWVQLRSIGTMRVSEYREAVADSVVYADVEIKPQGTEVYWDWGPGATFALVERLLGGIGTFEHEPRPLTAIELRLFARLCDRFNQVLARGLRGPQAESERRSLQSELGQIDLGDRNEPLIHVGFELGIEGGSGPFSIAYRLEEWKRTTAQPETIDKALREELSRSIERAEVCVAAELGHATLTLGEVRRMRPGDVIRLNQRIDQEVQVRVDKQVRFAGQFGRAHGCRAVRVTRVIEEES